MTTFQPWREEERTRPDPVTGWRADAAGLTVGQLTATVVSPLARCSDGTVDPDDWFPVATRPARARSEAARALALCRVCPVRAACLELSMRLWDDGGRHGVWGGFVAADRAAAHGRWLAGVPVTVLMETVPQDLRRPRR